MARHVLRNRLRSLRVRGARARLGAPEQDHRPRHDGGVRRLVGAARGKGNEALSPLDVGEGRAHAEMAIKYDVEFMCAVAVRDAQIERLRQAQHVGTDIRGLVDRKGSRDNGFTMSDDDMRLQEKQRPCKGHHTDTLNSPAIKRGRPAAYSRGKSKSPGLSSNCAPARGGCYSSPPPWAQSDDSAALHVATSNTLVFWGAEAPGFGFVRRRRRPALVLCRAPKAPLIFVFFVMNFARQVQISFSIAALHVPAGSCR